MIGSKRTSSTLPVWSVWHFVLLLTLLAGCGTHAGKGAAEGAAMGAASCAVGSLVGTLIFGGSAIDNAARSAVYCGAAGAFAGGVRGSQLDEKEKQQLKTETERLQQLLGQDAFSSLTALAQCDHATALSEATKARGSHNPNHALAGIWLEILTFADQRNETKARTLLPDVTRQDWDIDSESQAEAKMRESLGELSRVRKKYGLPEVCA